MRKKGFVRFIAHCRFFSSKMQLSTWLAAFTILAKIANSQTVTITNGTVKGVNDTANNVQRFLGIPYAQPLVGNLRLHQSIPLKSSFGTLNATAFDPACYGKTNPNPSKDCLTLNIWRPSDASNAAKDTLLPVLVWFYGGGLTVGYTVSSSRQRGQEQFLNQCDLGGPAVRRHEFGSNIHQDQQTCHSRFSGMLYFPTRTKAALISLLNYHLGPLGFLNGKQMADSGLLNLGMLDQHLALHWIQDNIKAFGGDPKKGTFLGQIDMRLHLTIKQ